MDLLQSVDPTNSGLSSSDPFRPSFFELAAQDQLGDLLKPALRYTLAVLAQRNPRYLLRVVNRFDEVYALLMWAIERHYLKTWGSSFAENFYGLRRRRRPGITTPRARKASSTRSTQASLEALRPIDIHISLLTLVGLPYVKAKLHDLWEGVGGGIDSGTDGNLFADVEEEGDSSAGSSSRRVYTDEGPHARIEKLRTFLKVSFRKGYPYVGVAWQIWLIAYNVGYLFEKTPFWRPWFRLMKMDVRRVGSDDYPPSPPLLPPNLPSPLREPLKFALGLLRSSPFIFFEALKYALPASIFFFKFLEWWYSPDNARRRGRGGTSGSGGPGGLEGGLKLDPPKTLLPHIRGILSNKSSDYKEPYIPRTKLAPKFDEEMEAESDQLQQSTKDSLLHNSCPLCGATPMNNPSALPSGYVFCYTCAFSYLEENKRCPITLQSVEGPEELRRVLG